MLSPDSGEKCLKTKEAETRKGAHSKEHIQTKKKTFLQGYVKRACRGRFAFKGLFTMFKKKICRSSALGAGRSPRKCQLKTSSTAGDVWDTGWYVRAQTECEGEKRVKKICISGCWHKPLIHTPTFDGICAFLIKVNFSRVSLVSPLALCVPLVPTGRCPNPCQPLGTTAFLFSVENAQELTSALLLKSA